MCGITGIFAFNSIGRINLIHLEAATRKISSRGPDVHNSWFDELVGLGHRRLSILDISEAGNQPMVDSTGRYRIVFNGEIYNFRSLRSELNELGVDFRSNSDTEVLLYAFIQWGEGVINRLNGFFAFAIYDSLEQSLFVCRDRFGIKPLVYYYDQDKFLFASEMKSLMTYGIPRKINPEALTTYFQLTYVPPPLSIFEGVAKLEPGSFIRVKKGRVVKEKYYKFPYTERPAITSLEKAKRYLSDTLKQSVQDRMVSDVPLGAFLSGGIDSSVIVALASQEVSGLNTFSIGFKDNAYFDETAYAGLVAKRFNTHHHVFSLTNDDLLQEVEHVIDYLDEPFADSSALPVYLLSRQTRKHVKVALSGDGADELFSGYNKHSAWLLSQNKALSYQLISKLSGLWGVLPKSRNNRLTDTFRKLDRFARSQALSPSERYWFLASFVSEKQVERLLLPGFFDKKQNFKEHLLSGFLSEDLNAVLALDSQLVLPGDMLQKVDLMSMAHGLEVRVPFLDHSVVELAFNMDSKLKATKQHKKIVLQEAFREMLPKELYHRPKHGFEVPLLKWLREDLKSRLTETVFNKDLIDAQGIFSWDEIARIRKQLYSYDPGDSPTLTWSLFVFQNWYKHYWISPTRT